jgi:signal transduction histidine kinase
VLQEALNNVAKHAECSHAAVRLKYLPDSIVLEVEDDGVGFGAAQGQGMGLISMRERAGLLNGRLECQEGSNGGALVRLTIPVASEHSRPEKTHA